MTCCGNHMTGIELRGIYDGVAYWHCPSCQRNVHRWPVGYPVRQRVEDYARRTRAVIEDAA